MAISQTRLKLAGWLSIVNILFFALFFIFFVYIEVNKIEQKLLINPTEIVSFALFIFLFLSFNNLLKSNFKFHKLTKLIYWLAGLKLFGLLLSLSIYFLDNSTIIKYLASITSFSAGIIYALLGFKLLKLNANLYKMRKLLSYTMIINGIWFAILSLSFYCNRLVDYQLTTSSVCQRFIAGSLLALLIRLVVYIMLAIVFFRGAAEIGRKSTPSPNLGESTP